MLYCSNMTVSYIVILSYYCLHFFDITPTHFGLHIMSQYYSFQITPAKTIVSHKETSVLLVTKQFKFLNICSTFTVFCVYF